MVLELYRGSCITGRKCTRQGKFSLRPVRNVGVQLRGYNRSTNVIVSTRRVKESRMRTRLQIAFACVVASVACPARAQLIPQSPNPFSGSNSSASAGCSLQASCAELAPGMIKSAEGPSPLEANLRELTQSIGGRI